MSGDILNYDSTEEKYLIFEAMLPQFSPIYIPIMLMNVCQKFINADQDLRQDIQMLLNITSCLRNNLKVIQFEEERAESGEGEE